MTSIRKLSVDEAAWLLLLSQGRRKKNLSSLCMSDSVLDALSDRESVALTDGVLEITQAGLDEVARLTELTTANSATLRSRANSLGARITPIPRNR